MSEFGTVLKIFGVLMMIYGFYVFGYPYIGIGDHLSQMIQNVVFFGSGGMLPGFYVLSLGFLISSKAKND